MDIFEISIVSVKDLHKRLGFRTPLDYPQSSLSKPLTEWKMEIDDAPIFRYLYRNFRPRRHLEFGTWEGMGVLYCLEECDATVWTINLLEGEKRIDGSWCYSTGFPNSENLPQASMKKDYFWEKYYQTDSFGFIGRYYLEKGLGNRVCQIYCDSRQWDISNYPDGFFDMILIDGGHFKDVVSNDTQKALKLLRSDGLILWHDFCPKAEVFIINPTTRGVLSSIQADWNQIKPQMKDIFWINPSWILLGIKK